MDTNVFLHAAAAATTDGGQFKNVLILGIFQLIGIAITTFGTILLARIGANTKTTAEASKATSISAQITAETVKTTDDKTNTLLQQTGEIHTVTNSNLSKVTAALEVQVAKNTELEKMVGSLNQRITEYEKQNVVLSPGSAATQGMEAAVKKAVVESVKAPVKEAVQESFTRAELEAFVRALKKP